MRDAGHRTPDAGRRTSDIGHRTAKKAKIIYPPPRGVDIMNVCTLYVFDTLCRAMKILSLYILYMNTKCVLTVELLTLSNF